MFRIDYIGTSPYVSCIPSVVHHRLCSSDHFLVLSSDGLYQYFSNEEVVSHVAWFMENVPEGDPAQYLIAELLCRAAKRNGQCIYGFQFVCLFLYVYTYFQELLLWPYFQLLFWYKVFIFSNCTHIVLNCWWSLSVKISKMQKLISFISFALVMSVVPQKFTSY